MICRTRDHIREQHHINHRRIAERSIYSGHYVFATNDYANGYLSDLEWEIYHKWVNFLVAERCRAPFGFIYLRATPENCFKRVKKRSRISEKNLTLSYIKQLDAWHEKFLIHKDGVFDSIKDTPVLILDCNDDFVENKTNMEKHLKTVNDFFERTYSARQNTDVQASNHTLLGLTAHTQKVLTS